MIHWRKAKAGLGLLAFCLAACAPSPETMQFAGQTMGTSYRVQARPAVPDPAGLQRQVEAELQRLNQVFSTYLADSEVSWLNRQPVGQALPLSADMQAALELSLAVSRLTDGAFDVTLGALVALWGFGAQPRGEGLPAPDAIQAALAGSASKSAAGAQALALSDGRLVKRQAVQLDFSAVAKGYAVDSIAALLRRAGARDFLVEIGGEVYAEGRNPRGGPWRIGIEKPAPGQRQIQRVLPLYGRGMATSGNYRNFFELEGQRYGHTLDPRTGWPVRHRLLSATVLHASTARADALATAFMVLGPAETLRLAEAHGLAVLAIIGADGREEEALSSALIQYLEDTRLGKD